jgi:hypothetical protein
MGEAVKRSSRYYTLEHIVEVKTPSGFAGWETICAFNSKPVAEQYAKSCGQTNPHNQYRVLSRNSKGQF